MEAVSQKSVYGGGLLKEEIKRNIDQSSSGDDDEGCSEDIVPKGPIMPTMEISSSGLQATVSSYQKNQEAQLKSAKAEMGEVMEENQRLKMYLDKMMKDYRALQMQFRDTIVQQEINKPSSGTSVITTTTHNHHHHREETDQESDDQFVSLCLGRTTNSSSTDHHHHHVEKDDSSKDGQLTLGLDCKLELPSNEHVSPNPSPEPSSEEVKEDTNAGDQKGTKTMRTDDEVSQQNPAKRARVSVRVRCDTPTMNDGCQWRKYGQKIAKGNPCPRAYYRCTVAPNCPVRKQVQRCAEDMSILITTYEGTHNHPLPISATAMASTTSAAACMLLSGSSTSGSALTQSATTNNNINGLNFYLSDNNSIKPKPFYNHLPNSSISSSSTSFPTITLDLTTNSLSSSSSSSLASSHLTKLGNNFPPRFASTTNLNFSSLESSSLPISWSNGVLSYGNQYHQSHNKNQNIGSLSFGRQQPIQESLHFQSYLQKNNILNSSNQLQPETLAAATKAITSDPNFQSALAAALTTIIGNSSSSEKLSESFPVLSSFPTASANNSNTNKCAPSFLNYKPPSSSSTTNSQPAGSLMFTSSPSLPFATSNSKSTSPAGDHNRDHIS